MKYSYDTNIFVNSLMDLTYRRCVDDFFVSKGSFIPRSLLKEFNLITHISSYISKVRQIMEDNCLNLLDSINHIRLRSYKKKYHNVYSYLKSCYHKNINITKIESAMIKKVNYILSSIQWQSSINNRKFIYPQDEDSYVKIISDEDIQKKKKAISLDDEDDIIHLLLCEALGKLEGKNKVYFISDDRDIVEPRNKQKIESIMEFLIVDTFKDHLSYYNDLFK